MKRFFPPQLRDHVLPRLYEINTVIFPNYSPRTESFVKDRRVAFPSLCSASSVLFPPPVNAPVRFPRVFRLRADPMQVTRTGSLIDFSPVSFFSFVGAVRFRVTPNYCPSLKARCPRSPFFSFPPLLACFLIVVIASAVGSQRWGHFLFRLVFYMGATFHFSQCQKVPGPAKQQWGFLRPSFSRWSLCFPILIV